MGIQQLKVNFTAYLLILIIFSSCHFATSVTKIDINEQLDTAAKRSLKSHSSITPFSLCELIPDKEWESIVVIGPYSNEESFENIHIKNFNAVKDSLLSASIDDSKCTLAYIKNNNIFGYSIIPRAPIDFCMYNKSVYIIKKSDCDMVSLKNSNDHLRIELMLSKF
jgi:hypothetical protein